MIKAKMIRDGIPLVRSHDLLLLIDYLGDFPGIDEAREYCIILSGYESDTRYPVDGRKIYSSEEAEEAYDISKKIPFLIGIYD